MAVVHKKPVQVYLRPEQLEALCALAQRRGLSVAELVRDVALEEAAESILVRYADQDFSPTDAVSFALMRQRRITAAFAFGHDFLIAGFTLMPGAA